MTAAISTINVIAPRTDPAITAAETLCDGPLVDESFGPAFAAIVVWDTGGAEATNPLTKVVDAGEEVESDEEDGEDVALLLELVTPVVAELESSSNGGDPEIGNPSILSS